MCIGWCCCVVFVCCVSWWLGLLVMVGVACYCFVCLDPGWWIAVGLFDCGLFISFSLVLGWVFSMCLGLDLLGCCWLVAVV